MRHDLAFVAAILSDMVRSTARKAEAASAAATQPERPKGIGVSALALSALLGIEVAWELVKLWGGTLIGAWSDALSDTLIGASGGDGARLGLGLLQLFLGCGIAAVCIWHYWKGRSWARLLVLLWSLGSVVRALSFLSEHNLDPAALMGRPLRFFQAALGAALLYWLNTPKVRAWYKKSSAGAGEFIADRLQGRLCTEVDFHSESGTWHLHFEHDALLVLRCPWRIVLDDNLAFASSHEAEAAFVKPTARSAYARAADQQPPETVPAPGHSLHEAQRLLENLRVRAVRLAPRSSDLFVSLEMGIELQTWSRSGGVVSAGIDPIASSSTPSHNAPLWEYSDPGFTMVANVTGVKAELAATSSDDEG